MRDCYYEIHSRATVDLIEITNRLDWQDLIPVDLTQFAGAYLVTRVEVGVPYRSKGVAGRLFRRMLAEADEEGVLLALAVNSDRTVDSLDDEDLVEWYQRCGFILLSDDYMEMYRPPKIKESNP